MKKKILLAINHKKLEETIQSKISEYYEIAGVAAYKDAVPAQLSTSGADTLLIREELEGSVDFLKFIKSIRENYPTVRIICITKERENKKDVFLATLVSLGIYDIINKNNVKIDEIVSDILHPCTFRDASQYYNGVPSGLISDENESQSVPKKRTGLFGPKQKKQKSGITINPEEEPADNTINIESMRAAITEEANRNAQKNLEKTAAEMASKQAESLSAKLKEKEDKIAELTTNLSVKTAKEIADAKTLKDNEQQIQQLSETIQQLQKTQSTTIEEYENRLKMVKPSNPDEKALKAQLSAFQKEIAEKDQSLQKQKDQVENLSTKLKTTDTEKNELAQQLAGLKAEAEQLKQQIADTPLPSVHVKELNELHATISTLENKKKEVEQKAEEQSTELNSLRQNSISEKALIQSLNEKIDELMKSIKESENREGSLCSQIEQQKTALQEKAAQLEKEKQQSLETEKQLEDISSKSDFLQKEKADLAEKMEQQETRLTTVYQQVKTLQSEKAALNKTLTQVSTELENVKKKPQTSTIGKFDISGNSDMMVVLPEDENYVELPADKTRTFMFVGSKHGVGNTTVALNSACALASRGNKTLYIEMNDRFPMIPELFEFIDIRSGIDTALAGIADENMEAVDAAIIKPHGLLSEKAPLMDLYKKLPNALHCMFFTNAYLSRIQCGSDDHIDTKYFKEFFSYLLHDLHYSYIIIDIQADDTLGRFFMANADIFADRLLVTCTQDPHSIVTTGMLLNSLQSQYKNKVIENIHIIINQYSSKKLNIVKISKWLKLPAKKFYKITEDSAGYEKEAMTGIPYVIDKGQYFKEYTTLGMLF